MEQLQKYSSGYNQHSVLVFPAVDEDWFATVILNKQQQKTFFKQ